MPRRLTYDGLWPVPGDGRYEWKGFIPLSELPKQFNPARGYIATANQDDLLAGYPIAERRIHHALFDHALEPLADPSTRAQMRVGPPEMGGAADVPHAGSYRSSDFSVVVGASFRMVLDVGNWDNSCTINTLGESGSPFSTHYRDLAPLEAPCAQAACRLPGTVIGS